MKWLFHSCLTLSRSSCRKSENTNQTYSMSKWFPKASFNEFLKKSITHAVKCLLLCDHQPCMCWLPCANEQLCATVSPDKKHCKAASIPFSVLQSVCTKPLVAVRFLPLHWGKTGWNHGIIVTFTCLEPQYFPGNPSSQPCIGKPLGFGLPYPSTCQPTFGPGEMYDRHGSFLAFRRADAYGSSSRQPWRPCVEGQQHCNFLFILFILHIDGKLREITTQTRLRSDSNSTKSNLVRLVLY